MPLHKHAWAIGALAGCLALPVTASRQADAPLLSRCHYRTEPDTVRKLPPAIREISGLAYFGGMLLAHDDEFGRVYSINPATGAVTIFATLRGPVQDDFEGIAVLADTIWLMTSTGRLYGLKAVASTTPVGFVRLQTGFSKHCELEGLAADSRAGVLLLPCKSEPKAGGLAVHRWDATRRQAADPAALRTKEKSLRNAGSRQLRPSAVEVVPGSTRVLLLSSSPAALIEVDSSGAVAGYMRLAGRHAQPEGLAITPNGDLYVSDEGGTGPGMLSLYRCRPLGS